MTWLDLRDNLKDSFSKRIPSIRLVWTQIIVSLTVLERFFQGEHRSDGEIFNI